MSSTNFISTRDEKTAAVDSLMAEEEKLTATIAQTTEKIADLTAAIAELDQLVKTSTETRTKDHATNIQTAKDAKEAQHAVAQALTVLREFYAKAGEATALVQTAGKGKGKGKQSPIEDSKPEIFETGYTGMQDVKGKFFIFAVMMLMLRFRGASFGGTKFRIVVAYS